MTVVHLVPYLTPEQATLLHYEGTLPPALQGELAGRLRDELAALRMLVPEPLAQDPAAFLERSGRFWEGSLLQADLSGFTRLTEELSLHGLRGIEELTTLINRLFGALLEELHAHGGIVLKFGGDAITGFFEAATLGSDHSAAACAAALNMQQRMQEFAAVHVAGRDYALRLRIGVHRGSPFGVIAGDARRREVIVSGRAVNRVAVLQEQSAPGTVFISAETLASLASANYTSHMGGYELHRIPPVVAQPTPPLPPLPTGDDLATLEFLAERIAQLRSFLPTPLPRHVLLPNGQSGGEFRPISALFINVTSLSGVLTLLEDASVSATKILHAYYNHIQRVIHSYGGEINKLDINSVGDKLLAIFGAPVAHEDDPLRAVHAALDLAPALEQANQEMREVLGGAIDGIHESAAAISVAALARTVDLSLRQQIGIATGKVFAGTVGSPRRREYTMIGRVVNLAARLMNVDEAGRVVIAPSTARSVRGSVRLETLPPLALKGFARKIRPAVVLHNQEPLPLTAVAPPMVNRTAELLLLHQLASDAAQGNGRVAAVSGEAGIGKSRLVTAFWEALPSSFRRLTLYARAYAQTTPYSLVRELLTQVFDLPVHAAPNLLWAAIDRVLAEVAPEFAPLAPLLDMVFTFGVTPDDQPAFVKIRSQFPLARMPQAEQRERLHDLIVALLVGATQQQPLALLIDDLHWSDDSSLALLQRLAHVADSLPLLLVLSYRSNNLPAVPWLDLPHTGSLALSALSYEDSRRLLAHLLQSDPAGSLAPILDRAQGSPFFLEALVRHLIDQRILRRDNSGHWQLTQSLDEAGIPETIELLLAAQIDQLDEATRELLQVAAVIGPSVPYRVLAGVYSQARQPARHLMELVRLGILASDAQEDHPDFHFRQTLLRDVTYQGILYAQRREIHRRVAERIEEVFVLQIDRFAAELAYHYACAEVYPRACAYALRAARNSRAQNALSEALISYTQAWNIAEQHPDILDPVEASHVLEEMADVAALAGRYEEAHRRYNALLSEAGVSSEAATGLRIVTLSRKIGSLYEQQSLFDEALELLHQARRLYEESQQVPFALRRDASAAPSVAPLELSRISSTIGWVYFRLGDPERARQWLDEALTALSDARNETDEVLEERARVYNRLGGVGWMLGNLRAARVYVERSLADFTALGDLAGKADAQNNLGILAEQLGDWKAAIDSYQAALAANRQSGRRRATALSELNLGAAHLQFGEPEVALPLLVHAAAETEALGDTIHEIMALRWLGRAHTRLAQFDAAAGALERALTQAREAHLLLEQIDTYTALGELAIARADLAAAKQAYAGGAALVGRVDPETLEVGLFFQFAAQVFAQTNDVEQSAALSARSRRILGKLGVNATA